MKKRLSVSSQSDTEQADLARESKELGENAEYAVDELVESMPSVASIPLAQQVAQQLMAKDALADHARDELGMSEITTARPVQAALTSAVMFSIGAAMPMLTVVVSLASTLVPLVSAASWGFLALLGAIGARAGGANVPRATFRVTFWGALAMAITRASANYSARLSEVAARRRRQRIHAAIGLSLLTFRDR